MDAMFYIIKPIYQRKKAAKVVAAWLDREYIPSPTPYRVHERCYLRSFARRSFVTSSFPS